MSKRGYDSAAAEEISCLSRQPFHSDDDLFNRADQRMIDSLQDICRTDSHTKGISQMYLNEQYSDCVLRVQGLDVPVNRSVLSVRCPHFKALFFGQMSESGKSVIDLHGVNVEPFKHVLKFIYSGTLCLNGLSVEMIVQVLSHSQYYCLQELVDAVVDYLKTSLAITNVFFIQYAANLYSIPDLLRSTNLFIDQNADQILRSDSFLTLSSKQLVDMFSRDSFYIEKEEIILNSVCLWIQHNSNQIDAQTIDEIFDSIRLWEISKDKEKVKKLVEYHKNIGSDLLREVTQTIDKKMKQRPKPNDLKCRGLVILNENVASNRFEVKVTKGRKRNRLINDHNRWYSRNTCTSHSIANASQSHNHIMVQLSKVFLINHIFLVLYDVGLRTYSYQIQVSVDRKTWRVVTDHRVYFCRSNQYLFFEPQPVKYIRIQGTDSMTLYPLVRYDEFDVLHFECMYSTVFPSMQTPFIKPKHNVFNNVFHPKPITEKRFLELKQNYQTKEEVNGDLVKRESIPFERGSYFWFATQSAFIHFCQPFIINTIIIELDRTKQYVQSFIFCIEVSLNNILWKRICDSKQVKDGISRVVVQFDEELALFVKITSSDDWSSDNLKSIECFHCQPNEVPIVCKKVKQN